MRKTIEAYVGNLRLTFRIDDLDLRKKIPPGGCYVATIQKVEKVPRRKTKK